MLTPTPGGQAVTPLLQVDGVTLAFGGVKALTGVGFVVQPGSITVSRPNCPRIDRGLAARLFLTSTARRAVILDLDCPLFQQAIAVLVVVSLCF